MEERGDAQRLSVVAEPSPVMDDEYNDETKNEEEEEQRFSTLEKKIRALEKSKKSVLELQKKMKRGIEMDPQQQAPRS